MKYVTATEFKQHFGKYLEIAKTEEVIVTAFGQMIFKTVPAVQAKREIVESLIGCLPKDATIGEDPDERG